MDRKYIIAIVIVSILALVKNVLSMLTNPFHSISNLILIGAMGYLSFMAGRKKCENYDYDRENPNARIKGRIIGGTVYASYPDKVPGLGWIGGT